jgi:hypothetical protein
MPAIPGGRGRDALFQLLQALHEPPMAQTVRSRARKDQITIFIPGNGIRPALALGGRLWGGPGRLWGSEVLEVLEVLEPPAM